MFTRKKSFYQRKLFYAAIAVLLAFGYWVSPLPGGWGAAEKADENAPYSTEQDAGGDKTGAGVSDGRDSAGYGQNASDAGEDTPGETYAPGSPYYLVKEIDGIIKIFHYDAQGNENRAQSTDISFSLLSEPDQQMFSEGVVLNTEDELTNLLQDFES